MDLNDLVGQPLNGFVLRKMTEVYKTNEDGRKTVSIGFFLDSNVAAGFAGIQTDAAYHKTGECLVLTNGKEGFIVGETVTLMDDEQEALRIREAALAKLSPAERAVLKL